MSSNLKVLEELYTQGKFDDALKLLDSGKENISMELVHYNKGVIYAKKQDLVLARIEFEKAKKAGMISNALENNLHFAQEHLGLEKLEEPVTFLDYFHSSMQLIPPSVGLFISLVVLLVVSFVNKKIIYTRKMIIIAAICLLPALASFWYSNNFAQTIVQTEDRLFEGPSQIYQQSTVIPKGLKVVAEKYPDGWFKIVYPSAFWGWVKQESLVTLE